MHNRIFTKTIALLSLILKGFQMSLLLYELVKSMTTSEKVYFKRNAKTHAGKTDKNYLKIYKVFEKAKKYDRDILSKHFKGTTIEKYLSSEVNYLKEKILISLFNFNLNKTKRNQIQKGILLVESLAEKGFQKEALKKLKTIKNTALRQEEYTWVLRLIELEEILIFKEGTIGFKNILDQLQQQRTEAIDIIQNLNKYHILREEVRELQFSHHLIKNDYKSLSEIHNNPLIASEDKCMSIKAKEHWFYIHVLISYLQRNFKAGLDISSQYLQFINNNIHLFDDNKILPSLSNYIFHAALNSNRQHFDKGLNILAELSRKKEVSASYVKYIICTRNLEYAYYANDIKLTKKHFDLSTELIDNYLDQYEEPQIQYIMLCIVRAAVVLKEFDKAIYYSNLWHQRGIITYRVAQAKLFSIIIHFELNYIELLKSEIILLKKLEKKFLREKFLLNCFYTFINSITKYPKQKDTAITKLQNSLKSISDKDEDYFVFISFDYYQWSLTIS